MVRRQYVFWMFHLPRPVKSRGQNISQPVAGLARSSQALDATETSTAAVLIPSAILAICIRPVKTLSAYNPAVVSVYVPLAKYIQHEL